MDLSLFSSSVNYPLPRVFQAPQCCQPNHQQRPAFHSHCGGGDEAVNLQTTGRQSAFVPVGNYSNGNYMGINHNGNGRNSLTQADNAIQSNCSKCCAHSNHHPNGHAYPNGNCSTNLSGSPTYPNGIFNGVANVPHPPASKCGQRFQAQVIKQNGMMRPPFSQSPQSSALQSPPGFGGGNCTNKLRNGSMDGNMFSTISSAIRQHQPPTTLDLRTSDCNPFRRYATNRQNTGQTVTGLRAAPPANAVPFTGEEFNGFITDPVVWNEPHARSNKTNGQLIGSKRPLSKCSMNALSSPYNLGIWPSGSNVDTSTSWERKIVKRSAFASFENNASEEDTCSLKSDSSSCSPDNFNCINPIQSLNLADNLRALTAENYQRLPAYSAYPVLQQ